MPSDVIGMIGAVARSFGVAWIVDAVPFKYYIPKNKKDREPGYLGEMVKCGYAKSYAIH